MFRRNNRVGSHRRLPQEVPPSLQERAQEAKTLAADEAQRPMPWWKIAGGLAAASLALIGAAVAGSRQAGDRLLMPSTVPGLSAFGPEHARSYTDHDLMQAKNQLGRMVIKDSITFQVRADRNSPHPALPPIPAAAPTPDHAPAAALPPTAPMRPRVSVNPVPRTSAARPSATSIHPITPMHTPETTPPSPTNTTPSAAMVDAFNRLAQSAATATMPPNQP